MGTYRCDLRIIVLFSLKNNTIMMAGLRYAVAKSRKQLNYYNSDILGFFKGGVDGFDI